MMTFPNFEIMVNHVNVCVMISSMHSFHFNLYKHPLS
jgi:hypothetical protein